MTKATQRARNILDGLIASLGVRRAPTDLGAAWCFTQTFSRRSLNLRPVQIKSEFLGFLELVQERRPRRVIEIGTASGGSLFLIARAVAPDAKIVSVDMPGGQFGVGYRRSATLMIRAARLRGQEIRLVKGDSHDPRTIDQVTTLIGEQVDLLFVDGDHTSDGVAADFEAYSRLVRPGGLVAFHDIVPGPPSDVGGVPRYWSEIKKQHRHDEFVEDWKQGGFGIGVLYL